MHDHGRGFEGAPVSWGRNSRLDNLQAAILNAKFNSFEKVIERRREIALRYHESLKDVEQVILPEPPRLDTDNFDTFQNFEIVAEKRNELQGYLKNNGVGTLIQWGGKSIHEWELLDFNEKLPVAELYFQKCLMLPINLFISDDDVHFVAQMIKDFYNHNLSKN